MNSLVVVCESRAKNLQKLKAFEKWRQRFLGSKLTLKYEKYCKNFKNYKIKSVKYDVFYLTQEKNIKIYIDWLMKTRLN